MEKNKLDKELKKVIDQARRIGIPVPDDIYPEVRINPRPKKRWGCCRVKAGGHEIEVSAITLQAEEEKVRNTLAHEILHACRGCGDHGRVWKTYAEMMNREYGYRIKRTTSYEEMGVETVEEKMEPRYIIKCEKCGREYPRQRYTCVMKKIKAYRCQCGGKLTLIKKV